MALDNYANFVRGALSASVDNSQTTFPVNDATIFPDPANGGYNLVVWDVGSHPRPDQDPDVEVVRVTARDTGTDELTVTRGQEATTGVSHPSGSALHLSYTAKLAADIETDYVAEGENFDGQGTSEFTNLAAVNTDSVTTDTIKDDDDPQSLYETNTITLSDTNTETLSALFDAARGLLIVTKTNSEAVGLVEIAGPFANTVEIIHSGRNGSYTNTSGNDTTSNIYHDGSNYRLENQEGADVEYSLKFLGDT